MMGVSTTQIMRKGREGGEGRGRADDGVSTTQIRQGGEGEGGRGPGEGR